MVFAYLFGGLVQYGWRPLSDVDIAVWIRSGPLSPELKLDLMGQIMDALGTEEIDLVFLNEAPISLAGRVLEHCRLVLDSDPFARHAYESAVRRMFYDFRIKERQFFARRYGLNHG